MYEATLHLQLEGDCVLSELASKTDDTIDIEVLELHDELVTLIVQAKEHARDYYETLSEAEQVEHVELLGSEAILVTKSSCGAYPAIHRNNGVLRRQNRIDKRSRVYHILAFQHEDITNIIKDFQSFGTVTVDALSQFPGADPALTSRQREVVETALDTGYFEWPRRISSEELATELGITRGTCLEHLRKAQAKLLRDAVNSLDDPQLST
ncbi:helix-turn-helix domain-containing protein [Haladaptatus caseinilyticus]|uniref:helix-turn-helix domain-containing protein n=1 Tax=Haladaptatus caseinilyticus TaxID=2993314 RepID=UPI00224B53B1|nr:helix-turn-helix domain-containing protein [Haladaptatus caseinilyticus]